MLILPTSYSVIKFIFFLELMYLEIKQVKQNIPYYIIYIRSMTLHPRSLISTLIVRYKNGKVGIPA